MSRFAQWLTEVAHHVYNPQAAQYAAASAARGFDHTQPGAGQVDQADWADRPQAWADYLAGHAPGNAAAAEQFDGWDQHAAADHPEPAEHAPGTDTGVAEWANAQAEELERAYFEDMTHENTPTQDEDGFTDEFPTSTNSDDSSRALDEHLDAHDLVEQDRWANYRDADTVALAALDPDTGAQDSGTDNEDSRGYDDTTDNDEDGFDDGH
jgi:hypothetical protein